MFDSALSVAVSMMLVLGVSMFSLRRYVAWTSIHAMNLAARGAALVYVAVLCLAVGIVLVNGYLPAQALAYPDVPPWAVLLGLAAALPCAIAPYWLELAVSRLLQRRHRLVHSGLEHARESVAELGAGPVRFAAVAIVTAVGEEVLFRGAVLYEVTGYRGPLVGFLAAGLVFGLHHLSFGLPAMAGKAFAGLLWSALMLLTGLLVVPLVAHLFFQLLVYRRMVRMRRRSAAAVAAPVPAELSGQQQ